MLYSKIKGKNVAELKACLLENGKKLSNITIFDLIDRDCSGIGVYIFHDKKDTFYIGKSSSRCFVERIPSHFDVRETGWFNTLLKRLRDMQYADSLYNAATYVKDNLYLTIIYVDDKQIIFKLEKLLRLSLNPILNPYAQSTQRKFGSGRNLLMVKIKDAINKI